MFRWLVSQRLKFKTERGKFIRLCGEFRRLDDTKRRKKKRTTNNIVSGNARNWLNFQLNVSNRYWNFDSAWVEMFVWTLTNLSLLYLVVALSDYQIGRPLLLARLNTCLWGEKNFFFFVFCLACGKRPGEFLRLPICLRLSQSVSQSQKGGYFWTKFDLSQRQQFIISPKKDFFVSFSFALINFSRFSALIC